MERRARQPVLPHHRLAVRPAYCYGASVLLASYDPDDAYAALADTSALAVPAQSATPAAHTAADIPSSTQPSAH